MNRKQFLINEIANLALKRLNEQGLYYDNELEKVQHYNDTLTRIKEVIELAMNDFRKGRIIDAGERASRCISKVESLIRTIFDTSPKEKKRLQPSGTSLEDLVEIYNSIDGLIEYIQKKNTADKYDFDKLHTLLKLFFKIIAFHNPYRPK